MFQKRRIDTLPLYLGTVIVLPRAAFADLLDTHLFTGGDIGVQNQISETLGLPLFSKEQDEECLILEIAILNYRRGSPSPTEWIFLRPFVELKAKLTHSKNQKSVATAHIKKKLKWNQHVLDSLQLRSLFSLSYSPSYDGLQTEALISALSKLREQI